MVATAEYHKEYNANRQAAKTAKSGCVYEAFREAFDRGPLNWDRRRSTERSLAAFCKTYGEAAFNLPWSGAHRAAIERIEAAVFEGEQLALAMPRGSGKSALCRWAVKWAIAHGHSPYAVLIGATDSAARKALKQIKERLRFSDLLFEDFPELCAPIRHLGGEARKATSQHFRGTPTGIQWGSDQIVTAYVQLDYAACSESVIDVAGITGDVRGRAHTRRDGSIIRPTVAVVDDFQTRKSARSIPDRTARLETINGDVLYLAGPEEPVGVVVPCTVIVGGDAAEQLLDRDENPEWHGIRTKFFESMPSDEAMKLWEGEYARLRRKALREDRPPTEATEFYIANREKMDEGAVPSWPDRYYATKGEVSGVQRGMNAYLKDRLAFLAEYQNQPEGEAEVTPIAMLDAKQMAAKVSGIPRGVGVEGAAFAVAMIDVHENIHYWTEAAVRSDFTGGPINKGVYPRQPTRDFTQANPKVTLRDKHGGSVEEAIVEGLLALFDEIVRRPRLSEDNTLLPVSLILVDTGHRADLVARAIKLAPAEYRHIIKGSRGMGFSPDQRPMTEYDTSPKEMKQCGPDRQAPRWYIPVKSRHGIDVVCFDAAFWKANMHARFCAPATVPSEWSLWGDRDEDHGRYVSHLLSQVPKEKTGRNGRTVYLFEKLPAVEDHWLDTTVGCLVGASVLGCALPGQMVPQVKLVRSGPRKPVNLLGRDGRPFFATSR